VTKINVPKCGCLIFAIVRNYVRAGEYTIPVTQTVGDLPAILARIATRNSTMKVRLRLGCVLAMCLAAGLLTACSHTQKTVTSSWDPKAAAAYLDQREVSWMGWPGSARDHGTFCVSCHTGLPYALSRPVLRRALAEPGPSINERKLIENINKRVRLWSEVEPFYSDKGYDSGKTAESRGTEAVLNALILARYDAQNGHLEDSTRSAFNNMWALQQAGGSGQGAWSWLQFGMEPWEAKDSQYYGAALAAIAVGTAPEDYRLTPEIQPKLSLLHDYLNREYATQSTMNRVVLLWASAKLPELIDSERRQSIIAQVRGAQQSDGGWRLSSLAWPNGWSLHSLARVRLRADWTRQEGQSDGYATGLITFALQQAGMSSADPMLKRSLLWLRSNQNKEEGSWPSSSINERRKASSNVGHFMRDAATAYAVLALSEDSGATSQGSVAESRLAEKR
jgi:squalene-hopene/tetraprenyl-beta-curcumene cyclase